MSKNNKTTERQLGANFDVDAAIRDLEHALTEPETFDLEPFRESIESLIAEVRRLRGVLPPQKSVLK